MTLKRGFIVVLLSISISAFAVFQFLNPGGAVNPRRSVYFWKSEFLLDTSALTWLKTNRIERIYVKMFDVLYQEYSGNIYPGSSIQQVTEIKGMEIVPVVFIENTVLKTLKTEQEIKSLAENIMKKAGCSPALNTVKQGNNRPFKELQIDCDWLEKDKSTYFSLLQHIKSINKKITLSATLRLYPFKYRDKMGIPPVDRTMLMVYNLDNPRNIYINNSIFSAATANSYLENAARYPLPIDVAMPAFEWIREFDNDGFRGFMSEVPADMSRYKSFQLKDKENQYAFTKDTYLNWKPYIYVSRNDRWLHDKITAEDLKLIARLTRKLISKNSSVAFFECTNKLFSFKNTEINEIFKNYSN